MYSCFFSLIHFKARTVLKPTESENCENCPADFLSKLWGWSVSLVKNWEVGSGEKISFIKIGGTPTTQTKIAETCLLKKVYVISALRSLKGNIR